MRHGRLSVSPPQGRVSRVLPVKRWPLFSMWHLTPHQHDWIDEWEEADTNRTYVSWVSFGCSDLKDQDRGKKISVRERRDRRGSAEGRWWVQRGPARSRAQRHTGPAQSSLSGCTAELLLLPHLLHHLDRSPLHTLPTLGRVPLLRSSFYLPVVPFNNQGARWYALQRRRALAGGRDGGRGVNKGFVSGACWQHTCCLKRADIRAQQDTVDGEGMEG